MTSCLLSPAKGGEPKAEWDNDMSFGDPIVCPSYPGHRRSGPRLSELHVVLSSPTLPDVVWTGLGECLLQESLVQLLTTSHVSGFEVKPVRTRFRDKWMGTAPPLWELVLLGWGGLVPPSSGIVRNVRESCTICGLEIYSVIRNPAPIVEAGRWDGSDIFMVWPLPRYPFVVERVATLFAANEISGVEVIGETEVSLTSRTLSPGRLSWWMPDARAHALGDALGIY